MNYPTIHGAGISVTISNDGQEVLCRHEDLGPRWVVWGLVPKPFSKMFEIPAERVQEICGKALAEIARELLKQADAIAQERLKEADAIKLDWLKGAGAIEPELLKAVTEPAPVTCPRPHSRQDPGALRVIRSYRVRPDTAEMIADESKRSGQSQGQVIDRLVKDLEGRQ